MFESSFIKRLTGRAAGIMLVLAASTSLSSCYDSMLDYEGNASDIQTDGNSSSSGTLASVDQAVGFLREAQMLVIDAREHKYQYQRSFISDDVAGYMSAPHNFDGRLVSTLAFYSGFASGPEANLRWVAQQVIPVIRSCDTLQIAPLSALGSILFSDECLQYTNAHGPMAIKDYKALKEKHPLTYQKQSEVYSILFDDLVRADSLLAEYQKAPNEAIDAAIVSTDRITQQKGAEAIVKYWRKYANSLILRMAMTAVDVEGYTVKINNETKTVKQLGEEAVQRGVLMPGDKPIALICGSGTDVGYHPLYKIANNWVDSRLNANYHNYLVRTQHPILDFWFAKNQGEIKNAKGATMGKEKQHLSVRSGMKLNTAGMTAQTYQYYSKFTLNFAGEPLSLFKVEETQFLLAEAALRGWAVGGSDEDFYNAGIHEFFKNHAFSEQQYEDYMKWKGMGNIGTDENHYEGAVYRDFLNNENDLPKYEGYYKLNNSLGLPANADTNPYLNNSKEQRLQKIITQKWIALFPMSLVAWTDYRRTGYPVMLPYCPFAYNYSDGSLDEPRYNWKNGNITNEGVTIRRIPYDTSDSEVAKEIEESAAPALDAETIGRSLGDKQGTRLWWDVFPKKKLQ